VLPILLVLLAKAPQQFGAIASAVFLLGCAVLAAQAFLYAMAPIAYPTRIRGMGVGAAVAFGRIGSIVGPKLGGALKAAGHGPSQLLMDLLPVVIVGSLCSLWLAWQVERRRNDRPM
jgi:AAHS family 3-hydroxyphenylpropionic acid transporter